ncbi:MAG TPA: VCBS repeat-containing protein [Verrucomicrobiae bacterium]
MVTSSTRPACNVLSPGLLLLLITCLTVYGGNYSQDFSSFFLGQTDLGGGLTLTSSVPGYANAHIEDGTLKELQLSEWDVPNATAAFMLPDLDPGNRIYSFSASWVSPVYGNFPSAGEGFSFSFGPVRPLNLLAGSVESGYGVGLCFSVITGTNSPGFYLLQNGVVIASQTNDPTADWGNFSGTRHAFQVAWDNDTGLTVSRDGSVIFTNVVTDGYVPASGDSFVWAARGGDASQTYRIDNLSLTTVAQAAPTIRAVSATNHFSPIMSVSADVDTRGLDTTVTFELGTNTAYGLSATQLLAAASGLNVGLGNEFAFDPDRQMALHARVTASNTLGSVTSSDVVFVSSPYQKQVSGIQGGASGAVWLDANDDGLLDLYVHGLEEVEATIALFHINRGATNWLAYGSLRCYNSFAAVGDFDNDNRPDVFSISQHSGGTVYPISADQANISYGVASNQVSQLGGSPAQLLEFPFYGGFTRAVVADFDHDGRQDILLANSLEWNYTGFTNAPDPLAGPGPRMLRNEFPGARGNIQHSYFRVMTTPVRISTPSYILDPGFVSSGDLDGDGFPDIYNYGYPDPDTGPHSSRGWEILHNDGEMGLAVTDQGDRNLGAVQYTASCSAWADFNGDGLDDLVVAEGGSPAFYLPNPTPGRIMVLLNDGHGHLTNGPVLMAAGLTDLAVGDIFNHGRNDIIVFTLDSTENGVILIFRNEGNGVFTQLDYGFDVQPPLSPLGYHIRPSAQGQGIQLADYDRDGRLDFCSIGSTYSPGDDLSGDLNTAAIYRNELDIPSNAPPQAPTNLSTVVGPGTVTFHWGNATDDITPTNLLTYNLRVGTNSLGTSVVSPLANVTTGWRKIAEPGNCRHTFSALYRFPPGTYYWSVQAVDGGLAGGAWAAEQTFTITEPERPVLSINHDNGQSTLYWPVRFTDYALQQGASLTDLTAATNAPSYDDGKIKVAMTNTLAASFFRLSKP